LASRTLPQNFRCRKKRFLKGYPITCVVPETVVQKLPIHQCAGPALVGEMGLMYPGHMNIKM